MVYVDVKDNHCLKKTHSIYTSDIHLIYVDTLYIFTYKKQFDVCKSSNLIAPWHRPSPRGDFNTSNKIVSKNIKGMGQLTD